MNELDDCFMILLKEEIDRIFVFTNTWHIFFVVVGDGWKTIKYDYVVLEIHFSCLATHKNLFSSGRAFQFVTQRKFLFKQLILKEMCLAFKMDGKILKYGFYLYKIETSSTFQIQMYRNQIKIIFSRL